MNFVRIPMMPKGVEHEQVRLDILKECKVRIPMMPKGVEHGNFYSSLTEMNQVRIPMMPKGVEHIPIFPLVCNMLVGANSDDAERR